MKHFSMCKAEMKLQEEITCHLKCVGARKENVTALRKQGKAEKCRCL